MVDIINFLPNIPTRFPSNIPHLRYKKTSQQTTLPKLSNVNNILQNDHLQNIHTKRWIGHSPCDPTRLLDVSNSRYSIYRKVMYQELSRRCPTTVDLSGLLRNKQQQQHNMNKDTTTIETEGINILSQISFVNGDTQGSRLFDTLSKPVRNTAEPLRPSNNFIDSPTNTLTSWRRYWTSAHVQRRRKEANDPRHVSHRSKHGQSILGQTHFVGPRDSPYSNSEHRSNIPTPSNPPSSCSPPILSASAISNKQITVELVTSSLIPSSIEINSSVIASKTSTMIPLKSLDKHDEKHVTEKFLLLLLSPLSHFKNDSEMTEEVAHEQKQLIPITKKVYKLSLPLDKPKIKESSSRRRRTPSETLEKNRPRTPSPSKKRRQISTNEKSANKSKQSLLPPTITTTPRSKYSQAKWDKPYASLRFDPPTPPCSPSLFGWPQNSDQEDSEKSSEKLEVFQHNLNVKVLENCAF